ncbi:MAG: hypothetical protein ACOX88_05830 [Christensenellales bacterium]
MKAYRPLAAVSLLTAAVLLMAGCGLLPARPSQSPGILPTASQPIETVQPSAPPTATVPDAEPSPSAGVLSPKNFFPLSQDSTWQYQGEGNEYATFSRKVVFAAADRAQVEEDNGGTVTAAVWKATDDEVVRTYFEGEAYDGANRLSALPNDTLIILKAPLTTGTKWDTPQGTREIVSTDAVVDTPAGKFEDCIKVLNMSENATVYEYFKEGVGMVKREFSSEGTTITSTLEQYSVK